MRVFFTVGLVLIATAGYSANQLVLKTAGPDRYPTLFPLSTGDLYVIWESEKYPPDYDILIAKYKTDSEKWIEIQYALAWPYANPYINHFHPTLAKDNFDDQMTVFAQGAFPPTDTIGDNLFWATSSDFGAWGVTWVPTTTWWKDCSRPAAATVLPELWLAYQDNHSAANPDIRAINIIGGQVSQPVAIADESYAEVNPAITGSAAGFLVAWEGKSGGSWNILAKKTDGRFSVPIAADGAKDELHPALASSGNYFYCAFTTGTDIVVAYSLDGGNNFHPVTAAPSTEKQDWPALACSGRNVDLAYYHASGNILHRRSRDNGVTWSKPDTVTTTPAAVDSPRVAIVYGNPCHVVWIDKREGSPDLYYGRAASSGVDEPPPVPVSAPAVTITPNPFSRTTTIQGPRGALEIYNALGVRVATGNGPSPFLFDGSRLPAGVYFVQFTDDRNEKPCKAILLK